MMRARGFLPHFIVLLAPVSFFAQQNASTPQGIFQGTTDIGTAQEGTSSYDPSTQTYRLSGGGDDVWGTADAFRFTWAKLSGDGTLMADMQVQQPGTYPKAKGMLMIRESLDPDSPYADIALHVDGHITLQYRATTGGATKDKDLPEHDAVRLQIARAGNVFTASVFTGDVADAHPASINLTMNHSAYIGLGVCSHSTTALQTVTFSKIKIASARSKAQ